MKEMRPARSRTPRNAAGKRKRRYRALDVSLHDFLGLQRGSLGLECETLLEFIGGGSGHRGRGRSKFPAWSRPLALQTPVRPVIESTEMVSQIGDWRLHCDDNSWWPKGKQGKWKKACQPAPVCSMLTNASRSHNMEFNSDLLHQLPHGEGTGSRALDPSRASVSPNCRTIMVKQWSKTRRTTTSQLLEHRAETSSLAHRCCAARKSRSHTAGTGSRHPAQYLQRTETVPLRLNTTRDGLDPLPRWLPSDECPVPQLLLSPWGISSGGRPVHETASMSTDLQLANSIHRRKFVVTTRIGVRLPSRQGQDDQKWHHQGRGPGSMSPLYLLKPILSNSFTSSFSSSGPLSLMNPSWQLISSRR